VTDGALQFGDRAEEAEYGTVSGADYLHRMKASFIRCRARPASSRSATPRIANIRLPDFTSTMARVRPAPCSGQVSNINSEPESARTEHRVDRY
jgi:hypothetical protein